MKTLSEKYPALIEYLKKKQEIVKDNVSLARDDENLYNFRLGENSMILDLIEVIANYRARE